MKRHLLILALVAAAASRACAADGELLSYDAKVRKGSFASDELFHTLLAAPHGVGQVDAHAFPHAIERKLRRIEAFVPYNGVRTGIELWTVEHAPADTVNYLITLAPDWQGSVTFQVQQDTGAPLGILNGAGPESEIHFAGKDFLFRSAPEDQRLYTPRGQSDMERNTDTVVLGRFPYARNAAALSGVANLVLENCRKQHAIILSARPIAGTDDQPGEDFASMVLPTSVYYEADFSRFKMVNGVGCLVSYQHRIYGEHAEAEMNEWLRTHGSDAEHAVLNWDGVVIPHASSP
ncbi:MAG TPA: hypothetical protein VHC86_06115 [Opitutaceae bacterium]|nr:hypothetical protein [Opitutaceae bacterium]